MLLPIVPAQIHEANTLDQFFVSRPLVSLLVITDMAGIVEIIEVTNEVSELIPSFWPEMV